MENCECFFFGVWEEKEIWMKTKCGEKLRGGVISGGEKERFWKKKKKNSFMLLYEKVQNFIPLKCKNVKKKSLFDFFILFYEIWTFYSP